VAPDVLSHRLTTLVEAGVLKKHPYREPGARVRDSYHLTSMGRDLQLALGALQQWGDEHRPYELGPTVVWRTVDGNRPVHVGVIDDTGREVPMEGVAFVKTALHPA
jgi:hypothetical protein